MKLQLFNGLFWGILLLASGVIILVSLFFKLQIQTVKLIFGVFVVLIGVSLLTSNFGWGNFSLNNGNTIAFTEHREVECKEGNDYFVVFGSARYDLSKLEPGSMVRINCAFGSCTVKLPSGNYVVAANSVFGSIHLPDGSVSFGNRIYDTGGENKINVDVGCAFGSVSASN